MISATLLPSNTDPAGASPSASPKPAGSTHLVVQRWTSRDGVHNSIAVEHIDLEPCDGCNRPHAVTVLTAVLDEGLLCPPCVERLREEAMQP